MKISVFISFIKQLFFNFIDNRIINSTVCRNLIRFRKSIFCRIDFQPDYISRNITRKPFDPFIYISGRCFAVNSFFKSSNSVLNTFIFVFKTVNIVFNLRNCTCLCCYSSKYRSINCCIYKY